MNQLLVKMIDISKYFGGVCALQSVNMEIYSHQVLALLGENGAGKSTLMKILSGSYQPTSGKIYAQGKEYDYLDHKLATKLGIGIIYQELSLIDELSVLENLFIGRLATKSVLGLSIIDWNKMRWQAGKILQQLGIHLDLNEKVGNLAISYKQMIEIAKVLIADVQIIIMDEPTSSLTNTEIDALFVIIKQLKQQGKAIIYISHKMHEIRQIADRYSILKDGNTVTSGYIRDISNQQMIKLMVGREIKNSFIKANRCLSDVLFEVKNLSSQKVNNVSFSLQPGEILGFAGLVGSGRTELMNCIFAIDKHNGQIYLNSHEITPKSPFDAIAKGIAYITENRRKNGFFPNFSILQNIALIRGLKNSGLKGAMGLISTTTEQALALEQRSQLKIKCHSLKQNISELSGGNQQKVIIAKWLSCDPQVIIFDEPTRGIDVGAKSEIYQIMRNLAQQGKAILMVSSELPEIMAICDRIAVFYEGQITRILDNSATLSEQQIMQWALINKGDNNAQTL